MTQTKYQVTLSVDGRHAVSVQSDDPAAVTEGLIWAHDTYKKLTRMGGADTSTRGSSKLEDVPTQHRVDAETGVPICGVHGTLMVWVDRNGGFWSCHKKENGKWCSYRPPA